MSQLVGQAEAEPAVPVLQDERINVDLLEVTCQEGVNLEIVQDPFHGDTLDSEVELDDLFDRYRKRALLVELFQELFCKPPQCIIREDCGAAGHGSRLANRVYELLELFSAEWLA